jgi:hypothetical protein
MLLLDRATLDPREHRLVDGLCVFRGGEDASTARASEGFVGSEGHDIDIGHRVGMHAPGDQARDMGGIEHEHRADLVGDLSERLRVDDTRVGGRAGDDQFRPVFVCLGPHLFHVDALVAGSHAVTHEVVLQTREVDRRTVGEMTAVIETQTEDRVARLEKGLVDTHVCDGASMGLHVGVIGSEKFATATARQVLDVVDDHVAAVVALTGVALGVLVGEHRTGGGHNRRRREVLARDQLDPGRVLSASLRHE